MGLFLPALSDEICPLCTTCSYLTSLSEVDLRECTLHSPPQKANKTEPTLGLKPRADVARNPQQGYQWPQKRICVRQKL